jgi:ribosomal protein S18 acetylase RimI-like enzyme
MIRPASPEDTPALVTLATATGLFTDDEADLPLRGVLDDLHGGRLGVDHHAVVWSDEEGSQPAGWAYFASNEKADRVWDLWWIGVDPSRHGQGGGDALMDAVEGEVRARGGRLLIIETSALPPTARARRFYERRGYAACGRIPDFYGDGDDKVIYAARMPR